MSEVKYNQRGFAYSEFKDRNGVECSIQKSSLATEDAIWFGANKMDIKEFTAFKGWVDHPEFDESTIEHHFVGNNRMHLTRQQVMDILPTLMTFVSTGELEREPAPPQPIQP